MLRGVAPLTSISGLFDMLRFQLSQLSTGSSSFQQRFASKSKLRADPRRCLADSD